MQTFLPYSDFYRTARCLDNKRLGKQRVEAYQILRTLLGYSKGWVNHPAVKMWRGYEFALCNYILEICEEWVNRGYKDTVRYKLLDVVSEHPEVFLSRSYPSWLRNYKVRQSHQSNLKRKKPEYYKFLVPDNLPYIWPTI